MAERSTSAVASAPPVLHVAGGIREALTLETLARLTTEDLTRYLAGRRWFAAKAGAPRAARIVDAVPVPWDDGSFAIARVEVETDTGARHTYQLPLVVRERATPTEALAHIESGGSDGLLFDAVEDAAFRRHLADAFARGSRFEVRGSSWIVEPVGAKPLVVPLEAPIELVTAEQSNTSIRFADEGIAKLFRRVEPGENPDVEIGRFLTTRASFRHTPALFGVARFEDRDERAGRPTVTLSGMLQEFLPGSVDVWSYIVEGGGRRAEGGDRPRSAQPSTLDPRPFASEAKRLGEVTRALHDALASAGPDEPDFVAEPARPSDVKGWARATEEQVLDALALLERQLDAGRLPSEVVRTAQSLATRRDEFLSRVHDLADIVQDDAGLRIRHHGDYHLGQVLRTPAGEFMIIDFEGEPSKSLAERRRKHSALRDVAGMLRSFAYAAATIEGRGKREAEGDWERDAREAFVAGYLGGGAGAFLPRDPQNVERLIELFETEKVFYELAYELNNRPDWVWIPMRALDA